MDCGRRGDEMRSSKGDKLFNLCNTIFMLLFAMVCIIPLMYVLSGSLMSDDEFIRRGFALFPKKLDFTAYRYVMRPEFNMVKGFKDTIIITVLGTLMNLLFTASIAYGLAKKTLKGRNLITGIIFFTMLFGGGMIPTYLVVRATGLINTYLAFVIPGLVSPWNMFILRNFFMGIPVELEESAMLDGANEVLILIRIIMPLSIPALATIGLFYAVGHWNTWFPVLLYIPSTRIVTIQYVLRTILANELATTMSIVSESKVPMEQLKMASLIVAMIPVIIIFPFVQKYFVKGVTVGSIKG